MSLYIFRKPKRPVTKVYLHCSASDNPDHDNVATMDRWHKQNGWAGVGYHLFIRKSGLIEVGRNLETVPVAQGGHNTGTIAICLHGLAKPKFTAAQFASLVALCHQINEAYDGKVTFHGHCEVAAKACPVFNYREVFSLTGFGVLARNKQAAKAEIAQSPSSDLSGLEAPDMRPAMLEIGAKSAAVRDLQVKLTGLGYFVGKIDGDFGTRTRDAVMAFQADNHLTPDGKFGALSREAMFSAKARPIGEARSFASLSSLASEGSAIAKATVNARLAGAVLSAGGLLTVLNDTSGIVSQLTASMGVIGKIVDGLGQWQGAGLAGLGLYVVVKSIAAGRAHVADYRSGKTA